jgi:O-antigen/teichoic acid export membrane protein
MVERLSANPPEPVRAEPRRIAFGTLARSSGEAVGKLSSLLLFAVVARKLGQERFGDFVFGMSLSTVLLLVAGLGMQELLGREVAKDPRRADGLVWNVIALKGLMMIPLLAVIAGVVLVQGRSAESAAGILIVSVGIALEYQAGTLYAVFDGRGRQQYVAATLMVNRISTAAMCIAAALAGAGLVPIAALFSTGSALGVITAYWLMHRYVLQPSRRITPHAWRELIRNSLPLGVRTVLGTVSFRSSVVLLGLLAAGSASVGTYGAAYRLLESTLFVAAAFNAAMLPWFARHTATGSVSLARGYELALKTVLALMLPIGLGLALFARPVIHALYGSGYDAAVTPLRLLGAVSVLWGLNTTVVTVLVTRNRPDIYMAPALIALVPNLALSAILIPRHEGNGAAITAVAAAGVLVALLLLRTGRLFGKVAATRVLTAPLAAGAAMAACALGLGGLPWVVAAVASLAAYAAVFLTTEKLLEPEDFALITSLVRRGR